MNESPLQIKSIKKLKWAQLILSSSWFIISALLTIYIVDAEDSSLFPGMVAYILTYFYIIIGIPVLVFHILSLWKSLKRLEQSLKIKKLPLLFSSLLPMVYYLLFSHHIYSYFYNIIPLIFAYLMFFLLLFGFVISVLFNSTDLWIKISTNATYTFIIASSFIMMIILSL